VKSFSKEFNSGSEELSAKNSRNKKDATNEIRKLMTNQNNSLSINSFIYGLFLDFIFRNEER
jgi:hypothetical protein|tara:strand:+ start:1188 stop:1373 length:186 start_codon:yes stop_codon:yes gene_type:complete